MEITANAVQIVTANNNVLFTDTPIPSSSGAITHREDSGIVKVRGLTNQPFARFRVFFNGNVAVPGTGTAGEIDVAISIDGEPVKATTMTVTPTATASYFNISAATYVNVPAGCCSTVAVENISTQSIAAINSNLIVERVA